MICVPSALDTAASIASLLRGCISGLPLELTPGRRGRCVGS